MNLSTSPYIWLAIALSVLCCVSRGGGGSRNDGVALRPALAAETAALHRPSRCPLCAAAAVAQGFSRLRCFDSSGGRRRAPPCARGGRRICSLAGAAAAPVIPPCSAVQRAGTAAALVLWQWAPPPRTKTCGGGRHTCALATAASRRMGTRGGGHST